MYISTATFMHLNVQMWWRLEGCASLQGDFEWWLAKMENTKIKYAE